ncbi:helix-turn-helix domain-containing protein [Pseudobacteroides cellulosolvens]|uniref:Helix-turn-helix domain protein n=1 Tax=Pseudobacteroides cellulosolvens ATCC 35603 = DSM 2933 TaxID=398512 RepID=A0A0L6JH68_9FIRM|nr:helix-turn-helix transcriptional regulator [Pseudobacteroides cellulosolvens]KNY24812.1 helix-turn-helix domain protein [Pseudobacteroides cellulosolvens ATCC 35603 = DSM 2933]
MLTEIYERIRFLRKDHFKLSQEKFGDRLGVSRDVIKNMELNLVEVKEHFIKLICREFNVSYAWLKTGEGEMFDTSFDDTTAMFDRIMASDNETAKKIFKAFSKLDEDEWKTIEKIIDEVAKK